MPRYICGANKKELANFRMAPAKTTKSIYHQFHQGHPMHATHVVKCNFDKVEYIVPNLVGGALPQCDSGNREYYCCTMLTLFFLWRDALSVKQSSTSWESAFNTYEFSTRQKQLMRNFNLRYECLDARDDFHAEMKKKINSRTPWHNDSDTDTENDAAFVKLPETSPIEHDVKGKLYIYVFPQNDEFNFNYS